VNHKVSGESGTPFPPTISGAFRIGERPSVIILGTTNCEYKFQKSQIYMLDGAKIIRRWLILGKYYNLEASSRATTIAARHFAQIGCGELFEFGLWGLI
jgi:hypothetical protein